jgi:hypothetical protein
MSTRRILVGTWEATRWAISFYRLHGFELVAPARKTLLLKTYWNVPDRQIEVSVVLASPHSMKRRSPKVRNALNLIVGSTRCVSLFTVFTGCRSTHWWPAARTVSMQELTRRLPTNAGFRAGRQPQCRRPTFI